MISINPLISPINLNRGKTNTVPVTPDAYKNNMLSFKGASDAASSYGKALVSNPQKPKTYNQKLDEIDLIPDNARISLKDAVDEMNQLKIAQSSKIDAILACTYDTDTPGLIINKKALMLLKANIEHKRTFPKQNEAIKSCINSTYKYFDYDKYNSMLDYRGRLRISVNLKKRDSYEDRQSKDINNKKTEIMLALSQLEPVKKEDIKVNLTYAEIFKPLSESKAEMITSLNELKKNKEISNELYTKLKTAINNNDFDLKDVYRKHYEPLNDMTTIAEVKEKYPEIKIPKKPTINPYKGNSRMLANRLDNEDYDAISLDIVRQAYVLLKPYTQIYVKFENSNSTSLKSIKGSGLEYSTPSDEMKELLENAHKLTIKNKAIQEIEPDKIKVMARKNAVKNSQIWADFANETKNQWFPVRLIRAKRRNPLESKYSTSHLVDTYILHLYRQDPIHKFRTTNPLAKYDERSVLNKQMAAVINQVYKARYNEPFLNMPSSEKIEQFASQLDKDAIGRSIEHLEKKYTDAFYFNYLTTERKNNLYKEIQKSYDIVAEKCGTVSGEIKDEISDSSLIESIQEEFSADETDNE